MDEKRIAQDTAKGLQALGISRQVARHTASKLIHRRKLFDGKLTAKEMHQKYAFEKGAKCLGCGRPPLTRIIVLAPLDEVVKRDAEAFGKLLQQAPDGLLEQMIVPTIHGPHIRVSTTYACESCSPTAERVAAKEVPSWCIVDINRGPPPGRLVSGPAGPASEID